MIKVLHHHKALCKLKREEITMEYLKFWNGLISVQSTI
jgi:hypothetical protein